MAANRSAALALYALLAWVFLAGAALRSHALPPTAEPESSADAPAEVEKRRGEFFASVSEHEKAAQAFLEATRTAPQDAGAWRGLGEERLALGEKIGAEEALRRAAELSGPEARLHGELGELYLDLRRPVDAAGFLESAAAQSPNDPHWAQLLARARREASLLEPRAPHRAEAGAAPGEPWRRWLSQAAGSLEAGLVAARDALPPRERERLARFAVRATSPKGQRTGLGAALALLAALLGWRVVRGLGDLTVSLEYPPELRGRFSVRIAGRRRHWKRQTREALLAARPPGASSRLEHYEVSRETQFRQLPPGRYYATVEGLLLDPVSGDVLSDHFEEQILQVRKGRTRRITFEFVPRTSPVEVKVLWDGQPVNEAAVASREVPHSIRFARSGAARIALPPGSHTLIVGSGDRVAEIPIEIGSFRISTVSVDLAQREALLFKGCPPAVKAYLNGELALAARALEREGQPETANLVLARFQQAQGHLDEAAEHFEAAGHPLEAATLRAEVEDFARAAALYQEAGENLRAAQMFAAAGDFLAAGDAYEREGELDRAFDCFRKAGDTSRQIGVLERRGDVLAAARLALERDDRSRAARVLQRVDPEDPRYAEACEELASIYEGEGHFELAAGKLAERIAAAGPGSAPLEMEGRLADLWERGGDFRKALEVLEALRRREPTWPNVATRIETLRKKISQGRVSGGGLDPDAAPTAFVSESRYELVEEIGRGGMGVVWKARDRRLNRVVALKRLPENLRDHPKAVQLFLREAQAAAGLNHPNIVTVYDADQEDGVFFITMELLEGFALHQIVRTKGKLSARDTARLGVQIAAGLDYAHERRIVHRDIKTANLFFTKDRLIKIMDFGLAKTLEEVRKTSTIIGGTPYYMSPEQAAGGAVDHRTDLYAFGVTLYEMATGEVPFPEGDVAYHHRHTQPPDPRTKVRELPDALAELILQMIAKDMEARPPSAREVGERLQASLRGA